MANPFAKLLRRFRAAGPITSPPVPTRQEAEGADVVTISATAVRSVVRVRGSITELIVRPRNGTPWLEAELDDGSGTIQLAWIGRRAIPGLAVGSTVVAEGRIGLTETGARRIFNPRYALIAT
ncbi:MAG: OB-fold nucleic acid binding domain-containing protein [Propionibacteriaceae bacterium]|jgi:hypothetical protein|nr:OB-fold nucleic acid binding domain-containing protein [Propionibacteriaceae bacterium]